MKHIILSLAAFACTLGVSAQDQTCKTNADLDAVPGKYLTAAQYPWPAARAEYFNTMATPADKAMAKQMLGQIENIEQQSHSNFSLTGGNWENYYYTDGYEYFGKTKLGGYTFQSSLFEYFCAKGKLKRNAEASTILRIYVNAIPVKTLSYFLENPYGSSMGEYDFGFQYSDWKNHKPADVHAQRIDLFTYFSSNNKDLIAAINNGDRYFQDVEEKDIRPNNRSTYVYRYWFVKTKNQPVLLPVSRREYLQSLLEYYEREKLYFLTLIDKLTKDHDNGVKQYSNWKADVDDKIAVVKKALSEHDVKWLSTPAVINRIEDNSQTYKAGLKERTNYNRFWKFYDQENKSQVLYKYDPEYFSTATQGLTKPQIITIAFRYVTIPSSLRLLNNFTNNFSFDSVRKLME